MPRNANAGNSLRALKVRDLTLLWSGQTLSSMGDGIFTVALAIVTLEVDHQPTGIALVFAATVSGVRHAILACGLISGLICFAVLVVPGVRDPERLYNFANTLAVEPNVLNDES